jgi:hypothetical protein
MANTKRGRPRVRHLIRSIEIRSVRLHMSLRVDNERSAAPKRAGSCWMEVRGVFDEPVKQQSDVVISVHEEEGADFGPNRPAVIGHVIQMRPECRVVIGVSQEHFERAWSLASGGRLTHAWMSLTEPRYNNAQVPAVAFANEPIE